jgi:hypothetical protein
MADLGTISTTPSGAFVMPTGAGVVVGSRERRVLPLLDGRKTVPFEPRIEGRRCGREENVL